VSGSITPTSAYRVSENFTLNCGFRVTGSDVLKGVLETRDVLRTLPFSLFRYVNFKTSSSMIGAIYCDRLSKLVGGIVNPIEKGHPDIIPTSGKDATERELRNYPEGLEIKTTIGNVQSGSKLRAGSPRINCLTGITWQAHHQEVESLMGLIWDFTELDPSTNDWYPVITGVFFCDSLRVADWGAISGTTGRNTKVTGMTASGKLKMGRGWVVLLDNEEYVRRYAGLLNFIP